MRPWTQVPAQAGRRFLITGANSGIGLEAARILGSRGAEVVMACRSVEKAEAAARTIPGVDKGRVTVRQVDLSDLGSVRKLTDELLAEGRPIDVLVNNAGVLGLPLTRSAEGIEMHFATNYLGPYALTVGLMPLVTGRVVTVSSREHRSGRIDLDDLGWERRPYGAFPAYAQSKLADLLLMRELDRRLRAAGSPVRSVGAHPGASATHITGGTTNPVYAFIGHYGSRLVSMPAWRGALCTVFAATADVDGGTYIGPHGMTELWGWPAPARTSRLSKDAGLARALWERSVELTGLDLELG